MAEGRRELSPFQESILKRFRAGSPDVLNVMTAVTPSGLTVAIPKKASPFSDKDPKGRASFYLEANFGRSSRFCVVRSYLGPVVVTYDPALDYHLDGFKVREGLFQPLCLESPFGNIVFSNQQHETKLGSDEDPLRVLSYCHMIKALRGEGYCSYIDNLVQHSPVLCGDAQCEMGNDLPLMTEYSGVALREEDSVLFNLNLLESGPSVLELRVSFEEGLKEQVPYRTDIEKVLSSAVEINEGEKIRFGRRHNTFMYRLPLV
jgi:hypothetical protein